MRNRLLTAPWWALSLLSGSVYALGTALSGWLLHERSWPEAVVPAVLGGVFFGAFMGPVAARMNRRLREAAGDIPPDQLGQVARLARRGTVPENAELRRAARRIALDQRHQLLGQRHWLLPLLGLLTAFLVWSALRDDEPSAFSWLVIALLLALLTAHLLLPRRLARRAERLADPPGEGG